MPQKQENPVCVLAIGEFAADGPLLKNVSRDAGWHLMKARDRQRAMKLLDSQPVHVVLAEGDLPQWNWENVLSDLERLPQAPQLIVTSRTADDHLWAEVLNLGGYDVLPQPLERDELERVVAAARRHYIQPVRRPVENSLTAAVRSVA